MGVVLNSSSLWINAVIFISICYPTSSFYSSDDENTRIISVRIFDTETIELIKRGWNSSGGEWRVPWSCFMVFTYC